MGGKKNFFNWREMFVVEEVIFQNVKKKEEKNFPPPL